MAVTPAQRPDSGNLTNRSTQTSGTSSKSDPTNEPGQYPPGSFFGIAVPSGTGAPGTSGAGTAGGDPTNEPGQVAGLGPFGVSQAGVVKTGAPGSAGAPPDGGPESGTTVTYTRPGSYLSGTYEQDTYHDDISGAGDWTQANEEGYAGGGKQLPGIQGNQPTSTGAGGGHVMRGGRAVRG
jgi:hypothetical protein